MIWALKPSAEVLDELIVDELEKFNTFDISTKCNQKRPFSDIPLIQKLPFTAYIHRSPTKFVELSLIWDTDKIAESKRMWLMLWFELMFESPARVGDKVLSYEEVSKLFTKDLIKQSIQIGVSCYYNRFVTLKMKVSSDKYLMLEKWAKIFMDGLMFDSSRIAVSATKLAANAVEVKRDGSSVCATLLASTLYKSKSNAHIYGTIQLEKFHEEIAKKAMSDPDWVVKQLEELRTLMLSVPVNMHLVCNDSLIDRTAIDCEQWSFLNGKCGDHRKELFI
ncbi:unnamed protein product, partial [Anisakis simplex]|uniref:Zinc finger, CCHC-type n=1 Tax=Anisakis simplex TaxID=6269 RepID=A0A0M3J4B5_ANISI